MCTNRSKCIRFQMSISLYYEMLIYINLGLLYHLSIHPEKRDVYGVQWLREVTLTNSTSYWKLRFLPLWHFKNRPALLLGNKYVYSYPFQETFWDHDLRHKNKDHDLTGPRISVTRISVTGHGPKGSRGHRSSSQSQGSQDFGGSTSTIILSISFQGLFH